MAEAAVKPEHCNAELTTMQNVLLRLAAFLLPLFLVACGDIPTGSPAADVLSAGPLLSGDCVRGDDGIYRCPSVEPIWDDDDDDECIQTTGGGEIDSASMQGCPAPAPGTGSPGGSTSPTPGGGGSPSGGTTSGSTKPSPMDDLVEEDSLPDCSNSTTWTSDWHGPYCNGSAPTGSLLTAYNAELNAMEAKGGICAELAQFGRTLLTQGRVRYYTGSGTTLRAWGGPVIGIIMDDGFVANPAPYDHGFALAHELEHAYTGYVHTPNDVDANGVHHTPNDTTCG